MTPRSSDKFDAQQALDVWKTIVGVQQHFNDLGWRIRSLAITALTFTLGAAFFGYLNADAITLASVKFNPSAFVPLLGLAIWFLFWFADGIWYHRLLKGAQAAAGPIEEALEAHGIDAVLSTEITKASRAGWGPFKEMSSTRKLNIFYTSGTIILCVVAASVFFLTLTVTTDAAEPSSISI